MDKFVITISRCCGAGGTTIGKRLAADLGVSFYDKNLLHLASEDSGINEDLFANADEKLKGSLLYKVSRKVYQGELIPPESEDFTTNENLFNYQAKVLKELAASESYVVIGRCADFILKDHPKLIRIFLYAPYEDCVAHEMEKHSISAKEAQWHIDRTDNAIFHALTDQRDRLFPAALQSLFHLSVRLWVFRFQRIQLPEINIHIALREHA